MDSTQWDARYREKDLVWSEEPNQFLVEEIADLQPGRALDVACGEGRNAMWLSAHGWRATGVDFSAVAIEKARRMSTERGLDVQWIVADLGSWEPPARSFDLVIVFYLQVPAEIRRRIYGHMAAGVAPGGTMLVVGHDSQNLTEGYGGPQDPAALFSVADIAGDLSELQVVRAEQVRRMVRTDEGDRSAIDALVRVGRPLD
jgi:2-polyprenyl-3-methyl-5-hydroxy-6-metoxy-1,4-benzoquinol methylase